MTRPTDDPTPPDPTYGLADPRTIHPSPEIFDPMPGLDLEAGPDGPPEVEPPGHDGSDDSDAEARGLVDPRGEIPDPTGP